MSELIADLPYRVVDASGEEFYVSVAGEPRTDGRWEGWLEYVPLDESEPLLTPTETTQSSRAALVRWAEALTETYVQGAFARSAAMAPLPVASRVVARRIVPAPVATTATDALPDPFALFDTGRAAMRGRLSALPRAALSTMITAYGLNPAGKSLAWLSDHQLVTFIMTAVEAQLLARKHTP